MRLISEIKFGDSPHIVFEVLNSVVKKKEHKKLSSFPSFGNTGVEWVSLLDGDTVRYFLSAKYL